MKIEHTLETEVYDTTGSFVKKRCTGKYSLVFNGNLDDEVDKIVFGELKDILEKHNLKNVQSKGNRV